MTWIQKGKDHTGKIGELCHKAISKKTNPGLCWLDKKAQRCRVGVLRLLISAEADHGIGMLNWKNASGLWAYELWQTSFRQHSINNWKIAIW